LDYSPSKNIDK